MRLPITIDVNPRLVIREMTRQEIQDFICEIDMEIAEVSFTEKLIVRLIESIENDLSFEEWKPYEKLLKSIVDSPSKN